MAVQKKENLRMKMWIGLGGILLSAAAGVNERSLYGTRSAFKSAIAPAW
jgi:hypothetical protein